MSESALDCACRLFMAIANRSIFSGVAGHARVPTCSLRLLLKSRLIRLNSSERSVE